MDQTNKSPYLPLSCFNLELMEKIMDVSDLKQLVSSHNHLFELKSFEVEIILLIHSSGLCTGFMVWVCVHVFVT